MSTTSMYIELIIIGLESIFVLLFGAALVDRALLATVFTSAEEYSVLITLLSLPLAYTVGTIVDRISKDLFVRLPRKFIPGEGELQRGICAKSRFMGTLPGLCNWPKKADGTPAGKEASYTKCPEVCPYNMPSLVVWKYCEEMPYYNFTMARKRVMRATIVLLAVFIAECLAYQGLYGWGQLSAYITVLALFFGVCAYITYRQLMVHYYIKKKRFAARKVEQETKNSQTKKKKQN